MANYVQIIDNIPEKVPCRPVFAAVYFDSHSVRIQTCREDLNFELKNLTKEQIVAAANFAGMMNELSGLENCADAMIKNVFELMEIPNVIDK